MNIYRIKTDDATAGNGIIHTVDADGVCLRVWEEAESSEYHPACYVMGGEYDDGPTRPTVEQAAAAYFDRQNN